MATDEKPTVDEPASDVDEDTKDDGADEKKAEEPDARTGVEKWEDYRFWR